MNGAGALTPYDNIPKNQIYDTVIVARASLEGAADELKVVAVVHAGVVTLVIANADGSASSSANRPLMFTGTMSTLSEASPACNVELNRLDSAENGADGVARPTVAIEPFERGDCTRRPLARAMAVCL